MKHRFHRELSIAGVHLRIRSQLPLDADDVGYLAFETPSGGSWPYLSHIDVEVLAAPIPETEAQTVYDNDGSWEIQETGDGYRLVVRSREDGLPAVVACCDELTERVTAYAGESARPASGGERRISVNILRVLDWVLLMNHLAPREGMVIHAAGAVVNGEGLLFAGLSTAGKSTLSRLLIHSGLEQPMLSDDRIALRLAQANADGGRGAAEMWGTPWCGDPEIGRNARTPLSGIFFLEKAGTNEAIPLDPVQVMGRLVPLVSGPWYDRERGSQVLDTCGKVVESVPGYLLRFRPDEGIVTLLKERSWVSGAHGT